MKKIVFITGATAGFGEACAYKFAANGYDVIINGRRKERLHTLANALEKKFNIAVFQLAFDVQDEKAVTEAIAQLPVEWKNIDVLVNNAGLALGRDFFEEANTQDWNTMIDTNIKGLLYVGKAVAACMTERKKGHIINMGSVAGKQLYEKGNVYCATKYAVDAITQGMRIDLLRHGIKVTAINPGAAETEFSVVRFKGDEETAKKIYDGLKPLSADDVADVVYYCTTLPAHVCINDLTITCLQQANAVFFNRQA
ncbi:MAG TPA: SDR family NAD(P)-dependent oxidoreductase [Chitinophagaceae bacterium]|nr:MAG: NADP-dependent 3-hydroxy acid dehydrogenase YdfG [Bacteroidetes bacterium ADurb.BinA245]HMW66784.1 SDR family NAD(P)-dependent oxidoreductase [Chitinophagaceae bacterium]HMX78406.1 SDR family NAD(P)-dependent oxidoreductase [Chitinophagaceae bacterium]HNA91678.1 SDR family NAD(P)-dependent oxidoreductase [Chitinophagaceae bacterium]HNA96855.1 SDR family NAD(P)-dependent oxidoreductase [Chitinophagaceae bacterium]